MFRKGGFLFSQAALPLLLKSTNLEHPPTLIFTSATAAQRGGALASSFSAGKFALKSLAQSLAREFGPQGVHVATAIIDGVIDTERTSEWKVSDSPDSKISPQAVRSFFDCWVGIICSSELTGDLDRGHLLVPAYSASILVHPRDRHQALCGEMVISTSCQT